MNRDQIVAEALGLFADRGFDRVTVRALGARVGLHNSSLFHHFAGKGEIVQGVLERLATHLLPCVEPLRRDSPPRLATGVVAIGRLAERLDAEEARFLLRILLDPDGAGPRRAGERRRYPALAVRLFTGLSDWLRRASAAGVVRPVAAEPAARRILGALLLEAALGEAEGGDEGRRVRREGAVDFARALLTPA
jgi:AcrR family transcriptional regulator